LAALASLEDGASRPAGADRYIADYLGSEYLSRLEPRVLRFLRRTSVLERMCAPLCNAVLSGKGSAAELEEIERANLFLVQLDHHRGWYRYHHLFRDLLQRDLEEQEPDLVPVLHRRASQRSSTPTRPETSTTRRASWARSRSRSTTAAGPRSSRAGSTCSTSMSASTDIRPSQFRAAASSPRAVVPKRPTVGCTPRSGAWLRGVAAWRLFGLESP